MMKQEFEQLIGKTVEWSVFKMYEAMYMATNLSKQEFVNLLNIEAIPEDPEVVKTRKENELRLLELKLQLNDLIEERDQHQANYREHSKLGQPIFAASDRYEAERCNRAIRELRWFIRVIK